MSESPPHQCASCGAELERVSSLCPACIAQELFLTPTPKAEHAANAQPEIAGWRIGALLGAGGMGRVHAAEAEDGTKAAIKILDARWSLDLIMAARFEKEADSLRGLDHPHILRLLGTTETEDGRLCLITELVAGCDLGQLLRKQTLPHERAIEIFMKVCEAVEYAHAQGFIHRDIKPSNILIGRDGAVKLADFGLAKKIGEQAATMIGGLTATTDQFGTAYYLAPERMLARTPEGVAADVYALGVLLYHLLTGRMPLGKFAPVSRLTNLPATFDAITGQALDADPTQRTKDVLTLRTAVAEAWRAHHTKSPRQRWIVAATVLLITLAAGTVWWWATRKPEASHPPEIVGAGPAPEPVLPPTDQPWKNSLGMEFVPLPGPDLLISKYETRRREYRVFFDQPLSLPGDKGDTHYESGSLKAAKVWPEPIWPVTDEHPAAFVGYHDARHFCYWLTKRERAAGQLTPAHTYRLPTRDEWLRACGGADATVREGNLAGPEVLGKYWTDAAPTIERRDDFRRTAPVGSFPVEPFGLYDISGNLSEWTSTDYTSPEGRATTRPVLMGPSWREGGPAAKSFSSRPANVVGERVANAGFRIVLSKNEPDPADANNR